jgi:two-component system, response regulator RegA
MTVSRGAHREQFHVAERSVLLVDDDRTLLSGLERFLRGRGLDVSSAATPAEALALARQRRPQLAVLDLCIGEDSGLELLRELKTELPEVVVIFLSGYAAVPQAVQALHQGAFDFLQKPVTGSEVFHALERAAERARLAAPSLARAEFEHIRRVLEECGGNISEAARRLQIHRRSLQRKLQKRPPQG